MPVTILDEKTASGYGITPSRIQSLVDTMQRGFRITRPIHKVAVAKGAMDILYEDEEVIVYRDNVGRGFTKAPELMGITSLREKNALCNVHRDLASEYIDTKEDEEYFVYEK